MGAEGQKPATSFLVFLSLCLSLFAAVVSVIALLMVNDQYGLTRKARASQEIRSIGWDWEGKIGRVEKALDRARGILSKGGEKSHESANEQMRSVLGELDAWVKVAEPRLQDMIAQMSKQAEEARTALRERSEQATAKLNAFGESLRAFREKVGLKKGETPAEEK